MAYNSYKYIQSIAPASPKDIMLRDKREHIKYLYNMAVDTEKGCTLNGREFVSDPRIFDIKMSKSSPKSLTMETVIKDDEFYIGDILFYDNSHWLCTAQSCFHGLYCKGIFVECNWLLKWQNANGEIIERWGTILSANKYNDGEDGNSTITLGSDQMSVALPIDEESLHVKRGTKFFIDNNLEDPTVYELTGTNNVTSTTNGHGVTSWIVKEHPYSPTADDLKYGVCDYVPIITDTDIDETVDLFSTISGEPSLKLGFSRTYSVIFMDKNENELQNVNFMWNIVSDFNDDIVSSIDGQIITLQVDKEELIGKQFILQIIARGIVNSEREITVSGLF